MPSVLRDIAESENYNPFLYQYQNFYTVLMGSGWSSGTYNFKLGVNMNRTSSDTRWNNIETFNPQKASTDSGRSGGFHCVIPVEDVE